MADIFSVSNPEFLETLASRLNRAQRTAVLLAMDAGELRELYAAVNKQADAVQSVILMTIYSHKKLADRIWTGPENVLCIGCDKAIPIGSSCLSEGVYTCKACWT